MRQREVSGLCVEVAVGNLTNINQQGPMCRKCGINTFRSFLLLSPLPAHQSPSTRKGDHVLSWESIGRAGFECTTVLDVEFGSNSQKVHVAMEDMLGLCMRTRLGPMYLLHYKNLHGLV